MKTFIKLGSIFVLIFFCSFVCGEEEQQNRDAVSSYRLHVGDKFTLALYGVEQTAQDVVVDPRGKISYRYIDSYPVLGKTIAEMKVELEEKLGEYYRNPTLSITPTLFNGNYYVIMGEVFEPGRKPLFGNATLLSAICDARGFLTRDFREQLVDTADLERSFLSRNGEYIPVDFAKLVREGDMSQDVLLQQGDYIQIARQTVHQVFIVGEVWGPTTIDYYQTLSLTEAVAEAGGVTPRASSRALVIRGSLACPTRYLIDINRIFKGCASDFILQPGDIVFLPPMQFTTLKEILQHGVRAFIASLASDIGTEAFLEFHPHADEIFISQPVIPIVPFVQ